MTQDFIITLSDMRAIKYCARGARAFCSDYGIDWRSFRENGIAASELEATMDPRALKLVEMVRRGR